MWVVIRYSAGKRVAYFTSEQDARLYAEDQCRFDERLSELREDFTTPAPDWGWLLVPMTDALRELLEA